MDVIVSSDTLTRCRAVAAGILIGQRATVCVDGNVRQRYTVMCVAPCDDTSVIMEQVECIEQILPANSEVIGVTSSSQGAPRLLSALKDHQAHQTMLQLRCTDDSVHATTGSKTGEDLGSRASSEIQIHEQSVHFSLVNCVMHSPLSILPLLITAPSGEAAPVDLQSSQLISVPEALTCAVKPLYAKQLGCAEHVTPSFPAVVCFKETSGCSLLAAMEKFVSRYGTCTEIVNRASSAKYTPLVYCHACDRTCSMADLLELIEDGMSETVAASHEPKAQSNGPRHDQHHLHHTMPNTTLLFPILAVCVLICAVLYALLR